MRAPAEFGAWYPRFSTWDMHVPWDRYKKDVRELLDMRLRAYSANVLWRAYGPTHFGGPTGTFTGMHPCHVPMLCHRKPAARISCPLCRPHFTSVSHRQKGIFGCGQARP